MNVLDFVSAKQKIKENFLLPSHCAQIYSHKSRKFADDLIFSFAYTHRPPMAKDITKLSNALSNHDCGNLARVVMVRKTDQRVINHKSPKV